MINIHRPVKVKNVKTCRMHFLNPPQTLLQAQSYITFLLDEINCINIFICEWVHSKYLLAADYQGPNLVGIQICNNPRLFGQRRLKLKLK